MKDERTLCDRCASDYRNAGYTLTLDRSCNIREPCDKCGRMGLSYVLHEVVKHDNKALRKLR